MEQQIAMPVCSWPDLFLPRPQLLSHPLKIREVELRTRSCPGGSQDRLIGLMLQGSYSSRERGAGSVTTTARLSRFMYFRTTRRTSSAVIPRIDRNSPWMLTGQTRANSAILQVAADGDGTIAIHPVVAGPGTVHVILDVSGYFEP